MDELSSVANSKSGSKLDTLNACDWACPQSGNIHTSNYTNTTYANVVAGMSHGLMTHQCATKLNSISHNATNTAAPYYTSAIANATTSASGLMSSTDKSKLNDVDEDANNYSHPSTNGHRHIPASGSSGQYLKYSSEGVAAWANVTWASITNKPTVFPTNFANISGVATEFTQGEDLSTQHWMYKTSDRKLKCNIEPLGTGALVLVNQLKPYKHEWKVDKYENNNLFKIDSDVDYGFLYDEVKEVLPEVTATRRGHKWSETGKTEDWQTEHYGRIDYAKIMPVLVKSIQELSDKVEELEKKLQDTEET